MFDTLTNSFKGIVSKIRFQDDDKALARSLDELKKTVETAKIDKSTETCK